jgi:hypothetical protein
MGIQLVARLLPTEGNTKNKSRQTTMPEVGFKFTTPAFNSLLCAAIVEDMRLLNLRALSSS